LARALHATRLAILATDDCLVFPASYFMEVPYLPSFLEAIEVLTSEGHVHYVSYAEDVQDYIAQKALEYRTDSNSPYRHPRTVDLAGTIWRPRLSDSTATDIAADWRESLSSRGSLSSIASSLKVRWPVREGETFATLYHVPERLEGRAFLGRFVRDLIPVGLRHDERVRIDAFVSCSYIASYLRDLGAIMVADFKFGDLTCGVARTGCDMRRRILSARRFDLALDWLGLYDFVHREATWSDLLTLRSTPEFGALAVAIHHLCPHEPFRTIAIRARRALKISPVGTIKSALATTALVAREVERIDHLGL
jgi:hypothetical protein